MAEVMPENFILRVSRRGEDHLVEAPEFRIIRHGPDLALVVAGVRREIEKVIKDYSQSGLELPVAVSSNPVGAMAANETSSSSSMRLAIICAAILIVFLIGGVAVKSGINSAIASISSPFSGASALFSRKEMSHKMSTGVGVVADTLESITPERREELVENLRRIAVSLEPYAAQLRPLIFPAAPVQIRPQPERTDSTVRE